MSHQLSCNSATSATLCQTLAQAFCLVTHHAYLIPVCLQHPDPGQGCPQQQLCVQRPQGKTPSHPASETWISTAPVATNCSPPSICCAQFRPSDQRYRSCTQLCGYTTSWGSLDESSLTQPVCRPFFNTGIHVQLH